MIREWKKVFDRHESAPRSWQYFFDKYVEFHAQCDGCPMGSPSAKLMHSRAKRAANDTAAGSDGWRPRELKLLPYYAWVERKEVLDLAAPLCWFPKAYYTVNTPAITKKGQGRAPLDHRLLAIFNALYRIEAGAWYGKIFSWICSILHESVIGAIPEQEALDIAWDAQAFLEKAGMEGTSGVLSSYDFQKYFDSFDHGWTKQMLLHIGLPEELVNLMHHPYSNMKRTFKKEISLNEPFGSYNGYGQGDVLSLLPAMLLVPWHFKMIDVQFPLVEKGAYYDDRNFRGTRETLVRLDEQLHLFDNMAGHSTQADKTAFLCSHAADRKLLKQIKLGGCTPKCPQCIELVRCLITTAKRKQCALQDKRFSRTLDAIDRIIAAHVGATRRIRAFCAKGIPMATYGMQWASPSSAMANQFRSRALRCVWGNSSKMRCMEIVIWRIK